MDKLKVNKLKQGDTIGFLIASSCNRTDRFKKIEEEINKLGYKVKYGKTVFLKDGYLAGSDQDRLDDIHEMFLDPQINAIICFKGGFGASRIVDKIDYEIIKNNPKLFMGFSDVTVLLNNFYKHASLPTVHGVVGIYIGRSDFCETSKKDFFELLTENTKGRVLYGNEKTKTLVDGVVEGEITGGNLSLISDLFGTDYGIDFENKIVLIEEVDEPVYNIDRMFAQLRLGKNINKAKGFIFGHFTDCVDSENENTYENLIKEYFGNLNVPIIYDFPTGHAFPFINVPIGLKVKFDSKNKSIEILEELYNE